MKKLLVILTILTIIGCGVNNVEKSPETSRFIVLEKGNLRPPSTHSSYSILEDTKTGHKYLMFKEGHRMGLTEYLGELND